MKDGRRVSGSTRPRGPRSTRLRAKRGMRSQGERGSCALLLGALFMAACSGDGTESQLPETIEVGVVLSSMDLSLTIFEVENPGQTRTIGLGPYGSPVTMAVRRNLAAVPLGVVPAVAVVDLREGLLVRTVGLPLGSGATGAAFLNDSIALIANPSLNSVTPVNVLAGTAGSDIAVGRFPQAVVVEGGRAFVLNAELEFFAPDGPSTVSVIDIASLQVTSTVTLSGENAGAGGLGPDGRLYIVNSGSFGSANGSLSVVDLAGLTEVANHPGFGEFPGSLALGPSVSGFVGTWAFVGTFSYGVVVWDASLEGFVRGPADALAPGGVPSTSGVGFDAAGRLYTLTPDCQNPSTANRHDGVFEVEVTIPVGICPFAIAFTSLEAEG
jgi:hypothetical protein